VRSTRDAATRETRTAIVAAREQRQQPTRNEQLLWSALRNRRFLGRKFRRQARIGHFVVDFYCPEERLILEVAGGIHKQQIVSDKERQQTLEELGLRVLRVDANACEDDLHAVLDRLRQVLPSPRIGRGAGGEGRNGNGLLIQP